MPKTIGKYELKKKLGEGGFGVVYLAHDTVLGDEVALKVAFAAEEHRASLLKEARLLRSLNHPNIVRVFEADLADDALYIAMEYLPGGNLGERMAPGPMALDETLGITRQLLAAVHYAHSHAVLHRDVKPANVLFDAEGTAKLTDFGVARMLQHTQAASTRIGTVPYMAPEQLVGEAVFRSDLYAAGVLLYEMATGARAFDGDTDFIVMQKISNGQFKKPREANPAVPAWLEEVINRAMDWDPNKRYDSADAFARALVAPAAPEEEPLRTKVVAKTIPAPALAGRPLAAAEALVRGAGLVLRIAARRHHPSVAAGAVIEQKPAAGSPVNPGAAMDVAVSEGPEEILVEVPDFTGKAFEKVKAAAAKAGLEVRLAAREHHPSLAEGTVISQDVEPGSSARVGAVVALVLSKGPEVVLVEVPDFTGLPLAEAKARAEGSLLRARVKRREFDSAVAAGNVAGQSIGAGTSLSAGAKVELTVSKGPRTAREFPVINRRKAGVVVGAVGAAAALVVILALTGVFSPEREARPEEVPAKTAESAITAEEPEAGLVAVTDVAGKGEVAARAALDEAGFKVAVERRESPTVKKGVVIEQRPAGGEKAPEAAAVTLVVSAGKPAVKPPTRPGREGLVAVPGVAGMAEANARVRLANAGFGIKSVSRASGKVAAGYVIGQTPAGSAKRGANITLYVSTGPKSAPPPPKKEVAYCPGCGAPRAAGAKFCGKCGYNF
jgi:beta-lactam-binding protein with PASTA domain